MRNAEQPIEEATPQEQKAWNDFGFASALSNFSNSVKDKLSQYFTPETKQPNTFSHYFAEKMPTFNLRERISQLLESVTPDFSPDTNLFGNNDSENFSDFFGQHRGGDKFLMRYTIQDLTNFISNSPIARKLEELGYNDWYIEMDLSDCFSHYGYLRSKSLQDQDKYIGFLIVQTGEYKRNEEPTNLNMLNIRWFSLQDPKAVFSDSRPRLPGQRYPGTGMAKDALKIFIEAAMIAGRDGIVNSPEHFHNAFLYENFLFLNPKDQGWFLKVCDDLKEDIQARGLAAVSWAIYLGFLRCDDQEIHWKAPDQVLPISEKLRNYFQSIKYKHEVKQAYPTFGHFHIVWEQAESYICTTLQQYSESPPQ